LPDRDDVAGAGWIAVAHAAAAWIEEDYPAHLPIIWLITVCVFGAALRRASTSAAGLANAGAAVAVDSFGACSVHGA
jgi:hypothetical protein